MDEFHLRGAEMWGIGVERLLSFFRAKVLVQLATRVWYLDSQWDVTEELFDGTMASEMSLGEAIVRGILPAPKYVTTVFKYQQDLDRWQKRVDGARAFGIRDEAQRYLDALRRARSWQTALSDFSKTHYQ